jgi:hypothetical protein
VTTCRCQPASTRLAALQYVYDGIGFMHRWQTRWQAVDNMNDGFTNRLIPNSSRVLLVNESFILPTAGWYLSVLAGTNNRPLHGCSLATLHPLPLYLCIVFERQNPILTRLPMRHGPLTMDPWRLSQFAAVRGLVIREESPRRAPSWLISSMFEYPNRHRR